jgi:hypothetical protein
MMRGVSTWAVAVRKPDGEIDVQSFPLVSWTKRHRVLRWPVIRGVVALVESLNIGLKALGMDHGPPTLADDAGESFVPQALFHDREDLGFLIGFRVNHPIGMKPRAGEARVVRNDAAEVAPAVPRNARCSSRVRAVTTT